MVICTEWKRFMAPNFDQLAGSLGQKLIFDGRNLYDPERLAELGWTYYAIGRGASVHAVVRGVGARRKGAVGARACPPGGAGGERDMPAAGAWLGNP